MSDPKLKPCPFCGSREAHIFILEKADGINVECLDCGASGPRVFAYVFLGSADPMAETVKCAVEDWNRRAGGRHE